MIRKLSLLLTSVIWLSACSPESPEHSHDILQFGTVINVTTFGAPAETAQKAFKLLDDDFALWQKIWNPWEKGSLSRANILLPTQKPFNLSLHLMPLVQQSEKLYAQSEGLYNPAIGKLINLWKFHEYAQAGKAPPGDSEIQKLVASDPCMDDITLSGLQLQSSNPDVQLNFGAFAKGYAIEKSMKTLRQLGINNAVINAGGDLKVIGQHGERPWRVAIRHPRQEGGVLASLEVHNNESVFTSGDYERFFIYQGQRYNHILDPRTGYPANLSQSVTVITEDAGLADAAATALFVAGPENWYRIAKKMGIKYVLLVAADGSLHMNPAMQARLKMLDKGNASVKLSPAL